MLSRSRILAAVGVCLLALSLGASAQDAYKRVADKIVCQCSCNYPLDSCPHTDCPWAPGVRALIRQQVAAGKSEQEILEGLVAQFGQKVLAAPPAEGFNIVGWVMPFVVFLVGLWVVRAIVLAWRRRQPPAPAADPALVARYRETIEKELERLEEV